MPGFAYAEGDVSWFFARRLFEAFFGKVLFGDTVHVSGAAVRPSLYDLLCQVPDRLCGKPVFVVGDRLVDRFASPWGIYRSALFYLQSEYRGSLFLRDASASVFTEVGAVYPP